MASHKSRKGREMQAGIAITMSPVSVFAELPAHISHGVFYSGKIAEIGDRSNLERDAKSFEVRPNPAQPDTK